MIQRTISVELGERSYPIYIGSGLGASFASMCETHKIPRKLVVITDRNVAGKYLQPLLRNLAERSFDLVRVVIPPGERQKSLSRANAIFTAMLKANVGRASAVVAFGGGVIGDLGGFVAATYQRGVPLVQVPTTLLAQVDSSVGGKVGVNHPLGKNMIGAFYQPAFVWSDVDCLSTLPRREVACGMGEIVKYGVAYDAGFFEFMEKQIDGLLRLDRDVVIHALATCCAIKSQIVSKDEKDSGLRMVLNFGHTIGHALESAGRYRLLKHGEAVLLGMAAESFIANEMGMIDRATFERIAGLIARVPLRVRVQMLKKSDILKSMGHDKKSVGMKTRFVLPVGIGKVELVDTVARPMVERALRSMMGIVR